MRTKLIYPRINDTNCFTIQMAQIFRHVYHTHRSVVFRTDVSFILARIRTLDFVVWNILCIFVRNVIDSRIKIIHQQ